MTSKKNEVESGNVGINYFNRLFKKVFIAFQEDYQIVLKTEFVEKVSKFAKGGAIAERYLRT